MYGAIVRQDNWLASPLKPAPRRRKLHVLDTIFTKFLFIFISLGTAMGFIGHIRYDLIIGFGCLIAKISLVIDSQADKQCHNTIFSPSQRREAPFRA